MITIENIKQGAIQHQTTSYVALVTDHNVGQVRFNHLDEQSRKTAIGAARVMSGTGEFRESWLVWEDYALAVDDSLVVGEIFMLACQHEDAAGNTSIEVFEIVHDDNKDIIDLVPIETPPFMFGADNWILLNPKDQAVH